MNAGDRYLDHAATSWPKPAPVRDAVARWFDTVGVSPDRGEGPQHLAARAEVAFAREGVAGLCGVAADRVAFCSGATEGLNLALRALLAPGDRIVATASAHSSVARPLQAMVRERACVIRIVPTDGDGRVGVAAIRAAVAESPTALLALDHASNVTGAVVDAAACVAAARAAGVRTLLDASQTAGALSIDVGADVVVASCHKSLHAPPGVGFVAVRAGLDLAPQKQGGTGSSRALDEHPRDWPSAFEAGTPNTAGLFGLAAALRWRRAADPAARLAAARARAAELVAALRACPRVRLFAATDAGSMPVVSFRHVDYDPAEVGAIASQEGFTIRTGHHCAPWIHRHLGTEAGGVVRVSPGAETSREAIAAFAALVAGL